MSIWINTRWTPSAENAVINTATDGAEIVAARARAKIRVYGYFLRARGTVRFNWESGSGGTALTGEEQMNTTIGLNKSWCEDGWIDTNEGESLNAGLSGAVNVDGHVKYRYIYEHE